MGRRIAASYINYQCIPNMWVNLIVTSGILFNAGIVIWSMKIHVQIILTICGFRVLHKGGAHIIDRSNSTEQINKIKQFFRLIIIRAIILYLYVPIANHLPALTHWSIRTGDRTLNHSKLLMRIGNQVIMNDDMVLLALAT